MGWTSEAQIRRRKGQPVKRRVRFTLRLPADLYARCVKRAAQNELALNDWIRLTLEEVA